MRRRSGQRIAIVGAVLVMLTMLSGCSDPWEPAEWYGTTNLPAEVAKGTKVRFVRFDLAALESPAARQFDFPTPDGSTVSLVRKGEQRTAIGGYVWHGKVKGDDRSIATLSILNEMLVGKVLMSNGTMYRVDQVTDGIQVVFEVDLAAFPEGEEPLGVTKPYEAPQGRLRKIAYSGSLQLVQQCDPNHIDMLVVYTDAACAGALIGGNPNTCTAANDTAIRNRIQDVETETNLIFANSLASPQVSIVHVERVEGYVEQASLLEDLETLKVRNLSEAEIEAGQVAPLQAVHDLRDQYRADVVSLITRPTHKYPQLQKCGKSTLMAVEDELFEEYAYTVVPVNCLAANFSFAHELGHVMGADHQTHSLPTSFPNNLAYVVANPSGGAHPWRTVMAQNDAACAAADKKKGCTRLPYFSNPDPVLEYKGDLMGSANRNNSEVVSNTVDTISQYRLSLSCGNT